MSWITIDLIVFFSPHLQLNEQEYISVDKVAAEGVFVQAKNLGRRTNARHHRDDL